MIFQIKNLFRKKLECEKTRSSENSEISIAPNDNETVAKLSDKIPRNLKKVKKFWNNQNINIFSISKKSDLFQANSITSEFIKAFSRTEALHKIKQNNVFNAVIKYKKFFHDCPINGNQGGINFTSGLNIFVIPFLLKPDIVVESGVFQGKSSFFLKMGNPNSEMYCFDINFKNLKYRNSKIKYFETNWMEINLQCQSNQIGFCFFDDHVNQALRVIQAYQRGFKYMIFDDSWPLQIPGCGWPPIPSIDSLLNNEFESKEKFKWIEGDKVWICKFDERIKKLCRQAKGLIKNAIDLPDFYRQTGIGPVSFQKFVELF